MMKLDSFQGFKDGSTYTNQSLWYTTLNKSREKKNDGKKSIWQNSTSLHAKTLTKEGRERT